MDIAKFVERRKSLHISQVRMCDGICTQSTLSKFESGGHVPSLKILSKLCARIGLTIDDLNETNKVSANQLKMDLDSLERELVMENYQKVLKGLSGIDEQQLDSMLLEMQFYYLRGLMGALINQPPEEVLYDFSQILNDLDESHETIFTQLVYVGSGVMYNRLRQTDRANFYFKKVHSFIRNVLKDEKMYFNRVGDNYLRLLTMIFFTASYYNSVGQLKASENLVNQGVEMCSEHHVTYFLPRLKFLAAKNAIEEKQDKEVVDRLINEVLAFARINENQVIEVKVAALNTRYEKGESLADLTP
ncbi:helix-turn-helix transcriptional regulator [Lactobacillus sp. LC28-10]|uniref:Helix-turn-helix transcriptional regulator n=1 Tax=Secundilactobacillus angelensis TaxID=2722706 RepID=A0ABX1L0Y3_9LACO|nr:helix-turn-helix transcriptional regulator [Secundilactobacillus angelensis]MCH5463173.1 helix-turn-helix domain-containing protein [Secundilactobacillus angelensis]NLR19534.1 helix-turn-helix transcriptional regulator [Secundilactobacillus angelensis]